MKKRKLLLVDGSSLLSSSFFGNLPREIKFAKDDKEKEKYFNKIMQTSDGLYTNGVYTMTKILMKIIKEQNPTHIAVAWDVSRNTFRRDFYKEYKGTRKETISPLKEQFLTMQKLLDQLGIFQIKDATYEADDFLGSLAKKFETEIPVYILTKDRDALQLVSDNTRLWLQSTKADEFKDKFDLNHFYELGAIPNGVIELTPMYVKEFKGVYPEQIVDLKALEGDKGDNIPGVKGVSEQTAIPLINEYGCIENLYDTIKNLSAKELKELKAFWKEGLGINRAPINALLKESIKDEDGNIIEYLGEESACISKVLGKIKTDIDIDSELDDFKIYIDKNKANKAFESLEFKSLIIK